MAITEQAKRLRRNVKTSLREIGMEDQARTVTVATHRKWSRDRNHPRGGYYTYYHANSIIEIPADKVEDFKNAMKSLDDYVRFGEPHTSERTGNLWMIVQSI